MDCIFCKIINNEAKCYKIYENELVIVFLDLEPTSNGHMLIVPKKHITDFTEMDNETLCAINDVVKKMQQLVLKKLKPDGIRLIVNYGMLQVVKHYHLHLIPVYKNNHKKIDLEEIMKILNS